MHLKSYLTSEFSRFLLVGGIAAIVNFTSRLLLNQILSFRVSVFIAYLIGMLVAYVLAKFFVFSASGQLPIKELMGFALVNLVAVIQVWLISIGLAEYLFPKIKLQFYANEIAHMVGIAIPVFTSYFGHKYFSFRQANIVNKHK